MTIANITNTTSKGVAKLNLSAFPIVWFA